LIAPVEEDVDVERALNWFFRASDNPAELAERIDEARNYYRGATDWKAGRWSTCDVIGMFPDKIAMSLAQGVALLRDRANEGARVTVAKSLLIAIGAETTQLRLALLGIGGGHDR
jgi:hypothetical protein